MPINIVRDAVNNSDKTVLNKKIVYYNDMYNIAQYFVKSDCSLKGFRNIKVKNIVALGRDDGWNSTSLTWRELINEWITGSGWTKGIFSYFENDIGNKDFAALGASRTLILSSYGGLLTCDNGNHRLVGAVTWNVSRYGNNAILKYVKVNYFPIKIEMLNFIEELNYDDILYIGRKKRTIGINNDFLNNQHEKEFNFLKVENTRINIVKYFKLDEGISPIIMGEKRLNISFIEKTISSIKSKSESYSEIKNMDNYFWKVVKQEYINIWKEDITCNS